MDRKVIIISAVNFTEGGPLSILNDCLDFLSEHLSASYQVVALVHSKASFHQKNILFIEFAKSKKLWIYRLYYEYFYFKKVSLQYKPFLWLSLHDVTPNVKATRRAVYCHNPSVFYKMQLSRIGNDLKFFLFNLFYHFVYRTNIHRNDFVIVQQDWIRTKFAKWFNFPHKKIIVAYPINPSEPDFALSANLTNKKVFFYPALGRVFKNFEVVLKACQCLEEEGVNNFIILLTIDGSENKYTANLVKQNRHLKCVHFMGRLSRQKVFSLYQQCDCLIFPSKLETWGLPISEFKAFYKPILLVDLPYARETLGDFDKVNFFGPDAYLELAQGMKDLLNDNLKFIKNKSKKVDPPFAENWAGMFNIILKN